MSDSPAQSDEPTTPWRVKVWWAPTPGDFPEPDEYDMVTTVQPFPEREPARKSALSLACCRGVRGIVLYNPDGDIEGHYDRFSNIAVGLWAQGRQGIVLDAVKG